MSPTSASPVTAELIKIQTIDTCLTIAMTGWTKIIRRKRERHLVWPYPVLWACRGE